MSDRRKTFATPLEFWQWAIMEPGKRRAKQVKGLGIIYSLTTLETGAVVVRAHDRGVEQALFGITSFPLTAVEDEHGAIEEDLDTCDLRAVELHLECLIDPKEEFRKSFHSHCIAGQLTRFIQQEATRIADERIAAATVMQETANGLAERVKNYRLKPKGDA